MSEMAWRCIVTLLLISVTILFGFATYDLFMLANFEMLQLYWLLLPIYLLTAVVTVAAGFAAYCMAVDGEF